MPRNNRPWLEQMTQSPLLINASAANLFQASIEHIAQSEHASMMLDSVAMSSDDDFWPNNSDDWRAQFRPYNVQDGVLQIPVMGILIHRFPYQFGQWATGYTYIEKAVQRGVADNNVNAIAFVIDSPGGEVSGCFELVDKIYEARAQKPMRSFAADHAQSAAYAIFSATGKGNGVTTRSGSVGNIGVVTMHTEYSDMLKDQGIKTTLIYAGEHKVDGNTYEKLPDDVKSRIQGRIDKIYGVLAATIARNRGMDEEAIRDTQALSYDADEALEVGLVDRIGEIDGEMAIFSEEAATIEDEQMANETSETSTPEDQGNTVDRATHEAAVADATFAGAVAEKGRIKAILACDEGKDRPKAAMSCAMNTNMSIDQAKMFLAELPTEKAQAETEDKPSAKSKTPFEAAMESSDNPNIGAEMLDEDDRDDEAKAASSILSAYAGVSGRKFKNR